MPTNLYGTGDNYNPNTSHVLPALLRRFHEAKQRGDQTVTCWGTGSPLREFLHAADLGQPCVFVLENWSALAESAPRDDAGQPLAFLNVGTGIDLSIHELATRIAATVGFNGTVEWDTTKPDGTPKKQLEVSRLRAMGWTAAISLPDGLARDYADSAPMGTIIVNTVVVRCAHHYNDDAVVAGCLAASGGRDTGSLPGGDGG